MDQHPRRHLRALLLGGLGAALLTGSGASQALTPAEIGHTPAQIHANFPEVVRSLMSSKLTENRPDALTADELRLIAASYALHTKGNTTDLVSYIATYDRDQLPRMKVAAREAYGAYWEPRANVKLAAEMRLTGVTGGDVALAIRESYLEWRLAGLTPRMARRKNAMIWIAAAQTGWDYGHQIGGYAANYIAENYPETWDEIGAVVVTAVSGSAALRTDPPNPPASGPIYRDWGPQPDGSYQVPDCCYNASGSQPDGSYQVPDSAAPSGSFGATAGGSWGGGGGSYDTGSPGSGGGGGGKKKKG